MLRTPFKLLLFFLFLGASAVLLTLGLRLWLETGEKIRQAEETFTTIGMVRQKENLMEAVPSWDAGTKSYTYFDHPVYEEVLPESILDFDDAGYLAGPEKRPVYGSWMPGGYCTVMPGAVPSAGSATITIRIRRLWRKERHISPLYGPLEAAIRTEKRWLSNVYHMAPARLHPNAPRQGKGYRGNLRIWKRRQGKTMKCGKK